MPGFLHIARWEGFKLRHRRMPWVLLLILVGFTQLGVWGEFNGYRVAAAAGGFVRIPDGVPLPVPGMRRGFKCEELRTKPSEVLPAGVPPQAVALLLQQCQGELAKRFGQLSPASSASTALGVGYTIGLVLLGVLGASSFGAEYGLGTLRPILSRGVGRQSYLGGKFLVLAAAATGALLLAVALGALSGQLIKGMALPPPGALPVEVPWAPVALTFLRTWVSLIAFLAIASSITILTRSTTAGLALSLGLQIFEALFIRLMSLVFSWFEQVGDYLPMHNLSALARTAYNIAPASFGANIGTTHASIVVALYVLAFSGLAVLVFRSRDIGGTGGG